MKLEPLDIIGSYSRAFRGNALSQVPKGIQNVLMGGTPDRDANIYNALAQFGGPTKDAARALDSADYIRYANEGAIRNKPISNDLVSALSFLPELGVTMEVFSGGQDKHGHGDRRTGSTRHDEGGAADVYFYKDGRRLDWAKEDDRPIFQEIVRRGREKGITGFGAGENYMRPGSMHIGFGTPAVWGAGGKGENAADWLRSAYYGS